MSRQPWIKVLFGIAALYDGALGVLFLVAPWYPFERCGITPPNHMGYIRFPAALLLVFAVMFFNLARDPAGRRELIPYGFLLKVSYCGVAGGYWMTSSIPTMWKPFVIIDAVMAVLFAWAYRELGTRASTRAA